MSTPEIQKLLHKFSQDIMAAIRPVVEQKLLADLQAKLQALPSKPNTVVVAKVPTRKKPRKKMKAAPVAKTASKIVDLHTELPISLLTLAKPAAAPKGSSKTKPAARKPKINQAAKKIVEAAFQMAPQGKSRVETIKEGPDGSFSISVQGRVYRTARKRDLQRYLSKKFPGVQFV